jgi:hypothetical protein
VWFSVGIPSGRANNSGFFRQENSMAECVFTITLAECAAFLNSKAGKEPKGILTKNRREAIAFAPETLLKIAEGNDTRFFLKREKLFILFNC